MIIKEYDDISTRHLNPNSKTKHGIGLCFFNPETELLQEFDSNTTVPILPYENSIRRFYIVRDNFTVDINTVSITLMIESEGYTVKTIVGSDKNATEEDFESVSNSTMNVIFVSQHPSGIIPLDVLITSKSYALTKVSLIIDMDVD